MNKIERFLHACYPRSDPSGWFSFALSYLLSYLLGQVLLIGAVQRHLLLLVFGTDNVSDVLIWRQNPHFNTFLVLLFNMFTGWYLVVEFLGRHVIMSYVIQHYGFQSYEQAEYKDRSTSTSGKPLKNIPVIPIRWTRVLAGFATSVLLPNYTLFTVAMLMVLCQSFYDNLTNFVAEWKFSSYSRWYANTMTGALKAKLASVIEEKLPKQTTEAEERYIEKRRLAEQERMESDEYKYFQQLARECIEEVSRETNLF